MGLRDAVMVELWESIQPGETVLFERIGEGNLAFGLYQIIEWAAEKGFRMIIADVLDSYETMLSKMKLMGLDPGKLSGIEVIKIGGSKKFGRIIAHIEEISEPMILSKKFKEAYEPIIADSSRRVLAVAVGIERLFAVSDINIGGVQVIVSHLAGYVGRPNRLGIYLVKRGVLPKEREFLINMLEDIATTVIKTEKKGRMTEFHIVKSVNRDLEGVLIRV